MKKILLSYVIASLMSMSALAQAQEKITFGTSADYPPFEFMDGDVMTGFDIELAKLIGQELGIEIAFQDMKFSTILPSLQFDKIDAGISTITITDERKEKFDFSKAYYVETLATVFPEDSPVDTLAEMEGKKIAVQLGTTMEIWANENLKKAKITPMNSNAQAIEALKAGHADLVFIDGMQAIVFSEENEGLGYKIVAQTDNGYGIAFKKGSNLVEPVNNALQALEENGKLQELKTKWLESTQWKD